MYKELILLFKERQKSLVSALRERSHEMDLGKQHQVYGAIKEIDFVINALNASQKKYSSSTVLDDSRDLTTELEELSDIRQS